MTNIRNIKSKKLGFVIFAINSIFIINNKKF